MTHIAVIHHLQQPFLGNAAAPLDEVTEYFGGALPELVFGAFARLVRTPTPSRPSRSAHA